MEKWIGQDLKNSNLNERKELDYEQAAKLSKKLCQRAKTFDTPQRLINQPRRILQQVRKDLGHLKEAHKEFGMKA